MEKVLNLQNQEKKKNQFNFKVNVAISRRTGNRYLYTTTKEDKKAFVKLVGTNNKRIYTDLLPDSVISLSITCSSYKYNFIENETEPRTTIELVLFGVSKIDTIEERK